ncbi:polysaccharide biosynthesis/export family protein [Pararhizobium mangrovi]|uniref:Uncharacterized protein n=1 Tax=Pararhizobium mangrovi TaxID=2590452 RepID=A0A506U3P7_9HYPH|nr:polysaccharide biosynthesis/export family protein [Pararhizobium mangrovi]TPW29013.1 hypothetical protein FJU11_08520 [Pararhizobium mangrovi]
MAFCALAAPVQRAQAQPLLPKANELPLAAGDVVRLDILDDSTDPVSLPVGADGNIQAPFLGSVHVAGKSIAEALDTLNRHYKDAKIFVSPKVSLAVESYRQIFVLGDVRQPGAYPFQVGLTVQKAVALAGGHIAVTAPQDPVLAQARIRGDIDTARSDVAREAISVARLSAQIAGHDEILDTDIPTDAKPYLRGVDLDPLRDLANRILKSDESGIATKIAALDAQITSARRSTVLFEQLLKKVGTSADLTRSDLDRAKGLNKRGLNTLSQVSDIERQLGSEESRQLEVMGDLSNINREIGVLESEIVDTRQTHHLTLLSDLQDHGSALDKAIVSLKSSEQALVAVVGFQAARATANVDIALSYAIRRDTAQGERSAEETSPLRPGDVVVVTMKTDTNDAIPAGKQDAQHLVQR